MNQTMPQFDRVLSFESASGRTLAVPVRTTEADYPLRVADAFQAWAAACGTAGETSLCGTQIRLLQPA